MSVKKFTPEERDILSLNPYVVSVTPSTISYSLAFKKFAIEQSRAGLTSPEIFRKAGFDTEMLGKQRVYHTIKHFKKEAASPKGLQEGKKITEEKCRERFAKEDYSKKQTKVAIRELQNKVVHLEQQIEFLKKIRFLDP